MKRGWLLVLIIFILLAFKQDNTEASKKRIFSLPKGVTTKDYLPNTLIIKFKEGVSLDRATQSATQELSTNGVSLTMLAPIFNDNPKGNQALSNKNETELKLFYLAKFQSGASIEKVINSLLGSDNIAYVEPSYVHTTWYTPNDVAYGTQFYLSQVKAPQAWEVLKNSSNVIISIVDTGSEITHQDLAANIYYNTADPINGVDDDGDGFVDNYAGWDLCGASASTMIPDNDPNVNSAAADHGVHVSGIASAVSNNGIGVASLASNAKLLIVKAGADDAPKSIYKGYEGIKYAADKGAHIINCSWGGAGGGQFGQDMVHYAISKGCLVVAAAGNSGNDYPIYPAAFDGVLAVANLNADDTKGSASNYGTYVDISAPGQGIYNTVYNNNYSYYSGTSMAAPLVSSAAALLKAKYPSYTGIQIGEILRATADPIDSKNPTYANMLGRGRLNAYRALTETAASVRFQSVAIADQSAGNRAAGTEVTMRFNLKNFLIPVSGLSVRLSSNSSFVQVVDQNINAGDFASGETKTNIGPIRVKVMPNAPENHEVTFTVRYTGNNGIYADFESFKEVFALDYLNINVNKISTTLTSIGRVGYSRPNATAGLGFVYKDENMLYEAALMIAQSETQVMNNARVDASYSEDFKRQQIAAMVSSSTAGFEGTTVFTDAASSNPIGLKILAKGLAYNTAADDKYVIMEYEIANTGSLDLENIYTGLFTDWDLDESSANATQYDAANKLAYVYAKKNATYPYAGVKLLKLAAPAAYYPLSYQVLGNFLSDNYFSIAEKYKTLTSGVQANGLGHDVSNGYDVMFTVGSGPYTIPKSGSIKVVYAFVAGDSRDDLIAVSDAAQTKYLDLQKQVTKVVPSEYVLQQNYPNAAKTYTYLPIDLPEKTPLEITIYNIDGRKVSSIVNGVFEAGSYRFFVDTSRFPNGIYTYSVNASNFKKAKKMVVAR
ncbi:MAG: S8/S53 family peptidase [Pedobacter sp.]